MIVKKFQGQTEKEAVIKAKEELGSTAVVLNVKTIKQRGVSKLFKKDVVEVTAALEENDFINGMKDKKKPKQTSSINLVADEKISLPKETDVIEKKLDSLHSLLETQIKSSEEKRAEEEPPKAEKEKENANFKFLQLIYKKLIDNEVDEIYANQIIGDIETSLKKEANIDSILAGVYQKIILKLGQVKTIEIGEKTKVVFFIGPTGVGKTTTIAKIASKFKLEKQARVAFITADTYRIAAVEQLNTYASIIDCPVSVVYSADELDECLEDYEAYDLILIDTAGRSHKSEEQMIELGKLIEKVEAYGDRFDYEIYLTLSITTKYKDLIDITERYKDIKEWSIIFTKLDETCALGNILNMKLLTGAALSYTTSGQNVPNDIEIINEQGLAKQLLGGNS
ncbi:MAG: flagellar biosynthesis protein FlhF [Eubacteriales bacterium]|nr:flagellar biosynthesis protein FlhF [Eubacteriales bacterium]